MLLSEGTREVPTGQSYSTGKILVLKLGGGYVGIYLIVEIYV